MDLFARTAPPSRPKGPFNGRARRGCNGKTPVSRLRNREIYCEEQGGFSKITGRFLHPNREDSALKCVVAGAPAFAPPIRPTSLFWNVLRDAPFGAPQDAAETLGENPRSRCALANSGLSKPLAFSANPPRPQAAAKSLLRPPRSRPYRQPRNPNPAISIAQVDGSGTDPVGVKVPMFAPFV
jgi:hypothetical protein